MKQGIVVCTWSGGKKWANLCLKSLEPLYGSYPIVVVINDAANASRFWIKQLMTRYSVVEIKDDLRELGAIAAITEYGDLDEFWLFQDSIEITDVSFIPDSFDFEDYTFSYHKNYMQYYLGKWRKEVLKQIEIPLPSNKREAIEYEWRLFNLYRQVEDQNGIYIIDPTFNHEDRKKNYLETKFGEERLSIVGKHLIKRLSLHPENMVKLERIPLTEEEIDWWMNSWEHK